jgi:hypothetical protein
LIKALDGEHESRLLKKWLASSIGLCFRRLRFGGGWRMRGEDERAGSLFSYVDLEARVGKDHPLRIIRGVVNEALAALSGEFSARYAQPSRPSIPPEKLLRAMLLQTFYSIRSERQLMERLEFVRSSVPRVRRIGVDDAVRWYGGA